MNCLSVGMILGILSLLQNSVFGYSSWFLSLWLLSLGLIVVHFWQQNRPLAMPAKSDIRNLLVLLCAFAIVYLPCLYSLPVQVNTDEFYIFYWIKDFIARADVNNPLGPSQYYGFPELLFLWMGLSAQITGALDFAHLRFVIAFSGLVCVVLSYVFFRTLGRSPANALGTAVILGSSHTLLAISRMISQTNNSILLELICLPLLWSGKKHANSLLTCLGGIFAGLTFYSYSPSRLVFALWLAFLLVRNLTLESRSWKPGKQTLIAVSMFFLTAAPMCIASSTQSNEFFDYQRRQILLLPEGRNDQRSWVHASSELDGLRVNAANAVGAFNANIEDHGFIYTNRTAGFVDALTGCFLWIGLFIASRRIVRTHSHPAEILLITGFLCLLASYAFVISKAPNYTRMLIILPFVAGLAKLGIDFVVCAAVRCPLWKQRPAGLRSINQSHLRAMLVSLIVIINAWVYGKYLFDGMQSGNLYGDTARLVDSYKHKANGTYRFVLVADLANQYFPWSNAPSWQIWAGAIADLRDTGRVEVIRPNKLFGSTMTFKTSISAPTLLFMNSQVWQDNEKFMRSCFPNLTARPVIKDGTAYVIELTP